AQIVFAQRTVSVGADVLNAGQPELENAAPGPCADRHPEPPQADTAAVALVPDDGPESAGGQEKPEHQGEVAEQVACALAEGRQLVCFRGKTGGDDQQQAPEQAPRDRQLSGKP